MLCRLKNQDTTLKLRGPGDLEGTQQSGVAFDLKIANLARDGQLVQLARDSASMVLDKDPALSCDENKILLSQLQILKGNKEDWMFRNGKVVSID